MGYLAYRPVYLDFIKPPDCKFDYKLLITDEDIMAMCKEYMSLDHRIIAIDTETTDLNHKVAKLAGVSLCFDGDRAFYIPVSHKVGENYDGFKKFAPYLCKMLYQSEKVLFFNARFDMRMLRENCGLDPAKVPYFDTQILVWNADTNVKGLGLKWVMENVLKWKHREFAEVMGWEGGKYNEKRGDKQDISYIDSKDVLEYAAMDAHATLWIWKLFDKVYNKIKVVVDIDNEALLPIMNEEEGIIPVDADLLESYKKSISERMIVVEKSVYKETGKEFNMASPKQLIEVMTGLGIDTGVQTETGKMSTGEAALVPLAKDYPFVANILEHRQLKKLMGTYVDVLIEESRKRGGGVYFNYKMTEAATGRLAGGSDRANDFFAGVNCQGLPKTGNAKFVLYKHRKGDPPENVFGYGYQMLNKDATEFDYESQDLTNSVRHAFKCHPGHYFVHIDFSQQELRLIANMTGCKMVDFFNNGLDLHAETAKMIFGEEVYNKDKKKYRGIAKTINFAIAYGGSWYTISENLNISQHEAEEILAKWWAIFPEIKKWNSGEVERAKKYGYVTTYFGRMRWVKHDLADDSKYGYAMRTIMNSPIQGTGADISKLALINIHRNVLSKYPEDCKLLLSVHDEYNFSVTKDPEKFLSICKEIKKSLEIKVKGWKVPMVGDFTVGTSYADGIPFDIVDDKIMLCNKYEWRV